MYVLCSIWNMNSKLYIVWFQWIKLLSRILLILVSWNFNTEHWMSYCVEWSHLINDLGKAIIRTQSCASVIIFIIGMQFNGIKYIPGDGCSLKWRSPHHSMKRNTVQPPKSTHKKQKCENLYTKTCHFYI